MSAMSAMLNDQRVKNGWWSGSVDSCSPLGGTYGMIWDGPTQSAVTQVASKLSPTCQGPLGAAVVFSMSYLRVGGLEHFFGIFPYFGNNHHPNWLSYFSEGLKPPTSLWFVNVYRKQKTIGQQLKDQLSPSKYITTRQIAPTTVSFYYPLICGATSSR